MTQTPEARTLSIYINRPLADAYAFLSVPENFSTWAAGLGSGLRREADAWVAEAGGGTVRIRFSDPNPYGVLDHYVTIPTGDTLYIPLRVIAHGDGAEVMFTLFRLPGWTDEQFDRDAALVTDDLQTLKRLLESTP